MYVNSWVSLNISESFLSIDGFSPRETKLIIFVHKLIMKTLNLPRKLFHAQCSLVNSCSSRLVFTVDRL